MIVIPNQPFGLGDIIFCQTLAKRVANGNPILWPVFPQFVNQLQRAYPDVKFVDWTKLKVDYDRKGQYEFDSPQLGDRCTVLPFCFAAEILGKGYRDWMRAKYELYGLDWQIWREDAMWVRGNPENTLHAYKIREFNVGSSYVLMNRTFGSKGTLKIQMPKMKNCIEIKQSNIYSLFDWAAIIQNAAAIHTVNTSIIYLLELLDLKAPEIHLYQRSMPGQTFEGIDYILQRHKYVFHA